jgi:xanthine dehydrogenase accessory factor
MSEVESVFEEAARLQRKGECFALASIVASSGSTPREHARMLVRADGTANGTIGGGILESKVVKDSVAIMRKGEPKLFEYALDSCSSEHSLGMECGGSLTVFIDVIGRKSEVVIVGAGHVGLAIAKLADFCGFRIVIVDEREGFADSSRFPMASELFTGESIPILLEQLSERPDDAFVIVTHSDDERALRSIVGKKWRYLGLLGSKRKVAILLDKMRREGVDEKILDKVRTPIGLDIGAETPEEIAVAVMAEIISDTRGASALHLNDI